MKKRKKYNPADSSAQHLANLIGTSVAGFIPETKSGKPYTINLSTELFLRNNVAIAELVIISGLIKGEAEMRSMVFTQFKPEFFQEKSFEHYLVTIVLAKLNEKQELSLGELESKIENYDIEVWAVPFNEASIRGEKFKWNQIISFEPTLSQIDRALEICRKNAQRKKWIE